MGIIDDYLTFDDAKEKPAVPVKGGGLIEQYLSDSLPQSRSRVIINGRPNPPISTDNRSGDAPEIKYTRPGDEGFTTGSPNPRKGALQGLISLPREAFWNTVEDASKSLNTATLDAYNDAKARKPASAIGDVALGALGVATSIASGPIRAVRKYIEDLTGNKDFADKVELLAGAAVPIWPSKTATSLITGKRTTDQALDILVNKVTSNGRERHKLSELVEKMKADPSIGPIDESPAVLNMAQKLFTTEGDAAKNYLHSTSSARIASSKDNINQAFDTAAGLPVNAVNKIKELGDAAKKVGEEKINPAVANSGSVNITPVIESINHVLKPGVMKEITGESTLPFPEVKKALASLKSMISNGKEQLTNANELHNFQWRLRDTADNLLKSASGAERQLGHALMNVRNGVVDAIDKVSPKIKITENGVEKEIGSYKPALSEFRDEKHVSEAFHDAYNGVLTNSKKLENRPEFTEDWVKGLTKHEKEAAIEGLRTRIDTEIGIAKNPALAGTSLGRSDFNQKKMEALLGKEETETLLHKLDNQRKISNSHNKIVEGSQTEMRHANDADIALPEPSEKKTGLGKYVVGGLIGAAEAGTQYLTGAQGLGAAGAVGLSGATWLAAKTGNAVKDKVTMSLAKERNLKLAKYAMPTEGPSRDKLIQELDAIANQPPKLSTRSKLRMLVSP